MARELGGTVPLGYDAVDRKLIFNAAEAETVRTIYKRYAELGSVRLLQAELDAGGHRSKQRQGAGGRHTGGKPFSRGILYLILQNRIYRGEIEHKDAIYQGRHEAIIAPELWQLVEDKLAAHRRARLLAIDAENPSLLAGLIFDRDGQRMSPTHANKMGRRYRYYISAALLGRGNIGPNTLRVPAGEIDALVLDQVRQLFASPQRLAEAFESLGISATELELQLRRADKLATEWLGLPSDRQREVVRSIVSRVNLSVGEVELIISRQGLSALLLGKRSPVNSDPTDLVVLVPTKLRRFGKGKRMIIGEVQPSWIDATLVRLIQEAHAIRDVVLADSAETLNEITARRQKSNGHLTALMRISYLAPSIVEDVLNGRQPPELGAKRLLRASNTLPLDWASQRTQLGFR